MRLVISIILLSLQLPLLAQFSDNFSDGDFSNNPTWIGDVSQFVVNESFELNFAGNSVDGGVSYLSTYSTSIIDASWEFFVNLDFNPSASNYADIFLCSNQADLTTSTQGYFVRIGNTADEVSLYRKDENEEIIIIDGLDDRIDMSQVNLRVRVTRDADANWELSVDAGGGANYIVEGNVQDDTYIDNNQYFGVLCEYTSSRSDKFKFDDFVVSGNEYADNLAPVLLSYQIMNSQEILLVFNENLDYVTSHNENNYSINNGIGTPENISYLGLDSSKVLLQLTHQLISPNEYTLTYQNIEDRNANIIETGSISFTYYEVSEGAIVINEIMADPSPPVGLPEVEYIELYNRENHSIDLENWSCKIGNTTKQLPAYSLAPNEYVVLCNANNVSELEIYGNVIGLASFPAIVNSGQTISIHDTLGNIINEISFANTWYADSEKEDGGWALERIDPNNLCLKKSNWKASNNEIGGTPGTQNSVFSINIDTVPPSLISVVPLLSNQLVITFSEEIALSEALNSINYSIEGIGNPSFVMQSLDYQNAVIAQFANSFPENVNLSLNVDNISDLCGNAMHAQNIQFILYVPSPYDLIISEIMANPSPVVLLPEVEYIELYNRTEFELNLSTWKLVVGSSIKEFPNCVIEPNNYLLVCDIENIELFSENINVVGISDFPNLSNSSADLVLYSNSDKVINTVTYDDSWYQDNFKKEGGYSLEIVDVNNPCEEFGNWIASKHISGGTPGQENSVYDENPDILYPYPIAAEVIMPDTLIVYFNEILDQTNLESLSNYYVEGIGNPVWISAEAPRFSTIKMKFDSNIEESQLYYLSIYDSISDCSGNAVPYSTRIRFALGDSICKNDLVINELLFNPHPSGYDFVELYNNSDKIVDLKSVWISNLDDEGKIDDTQQISEISRLLLPGEHVAICEEPSNLENEYTVLYPDSLFMIDALPSMPDDYGVVLITTRYLDTIDLVAYSEDQHYKLLANDNGVSLERIDYDAASSALSNWHSASQDAGFATPGYVNSQYSKKPDFEVDFISVSPEVFSPDNDGYNDRLDIVYNLEKSGYTANIAIYSSEGKLVTYIARNQLLGVEGNLFWDGFDMNNRVCSPGIYILFVEMFNVDGDKILDKIPFVLSVKN